MIDRWILATIVLMALATYLARIRGYLVLGGRALSSRTMIVLDTAPGCVRIAVIAPVFISGRLADLIALSLTMVAATRLPMLPTLLIGVGSAGLARSMFGYADFPRSLSTADRRLIIQTRHSRNSIDFDKADPFSPKSVSGKLLVRCRLHTELVADARGRFGGAAPPSSKAAASNWSAASLRWLRRALSKLPGRHSPIWLGLARDNHRFCSYLGLTSKYLVL